MGKSISHVSHKLLEIESTNNIIWVAGFPGRRVPRSVIQRSSTSWVILGVIISHFDHCAVVPSDP